LYGHVRDARERARLAPHVSVFGQGSANHFTTMIHGTGEPPLEVNRLVGEPVDHFVEDHLPSEMGFVHSAKGKGLRHSRVVQLWIDVPQLSSSALGRLHEVPRTDGVHLGLVIEASQITDDGLRGLESLASVDSLVLRGARLPLSVAAALKDALPDCAVEIEARVADGMNTGDGATFSR
jgi:hypothetical protein